MFPPELRGMPPEWLALFPAAPLGPALVLAAPLPVMKTSLEVVAFGGNTSSSPEAAEFDVGAEPSVYVELRSSAPVANVSEAVTLQGQYGGSGGAFRVDATVTSRWPPVQGTEWLELAPLGTLDLASATSFVLATWTYSSSVTVGLTPPNGALAD